MNPGEKRESMKRILTVLLCVTLVFAVAGCQKNIDPKAAYQAAAAKSQELKSTDMSMDMNIKGDIEGQSIETNVKIEMKNVPKDGGDADVAMKMTMNILGVTIEIPFYYTDGTFYMEMMGQKMKAKMDKSQFESQTGETGLEVLSQDFFQELKEEKQGDNTRYTFTGNPDKLGDFSKSIMDQLESSLQGSSATIGEVKISKADGTFDIDKNGYISAQTLNMEFSVDVDGTTTNFTASQSVKLNNPGETVTIEFPDFTSYQEVDSSALGSMLPAA